jgi:hypothetical protein
MQIMQRELTQLQNPTIRLQFNLRVFWLCLRAEHELAGGDGDGALLSAEGCKGDVGGLLAAHEHGAEGGAHAGAAVQLSHLPRMTPD